MKITFILLGILFTQAGFASDILKFFGVEKINIYRVPEEGIVLDSATTIQADQIVLNGPILTKGNRLTLIAYNIDFKENGAIYTFQREGMPYELRECLVSIPANDKTIPFISQSDWTTTAINAERKDGAKEGKPGKNGEKGFNGHKGIMGRADVYPVNLIANTISGDIKIFANGEKGGDGGDGGPGQSGQNGQQGGKGFAKCHGKFKGKTEKRPGRGGPGGLGGSGGDGGDGGLGGLNPEVNILTTFDFAKDAIIESSPGMNGVPGIPGPNGSHGAPGKPGEDDSDSDDWEIGPFKTKHCRASSGSATPREERKERFWNGPAAREGEIPSEFGCYNLRGNKKAVIKDVLSFGSDNVRIRQNLKRTYLEMRFYTLLVQTLANITKLPNRLILISGNIEIQNNAKKEIVETLRKNWNNRFFLPLEKSDSHTLGLGFKEDLMNMSSKIMKALDLALEGDFTGSADAFSSLNDEMKARLSYSVKGLSKDCHDYKKTRKEEISRSLSLMREADPAKAMSCINSLAYTKRPSFIDTIKDAKVRSDMDADIKQRITSELNAYGDIAELLKGKSRQDSTHITENETSKVFSVPFCDDLQLDIDSPESVVSFLTKRLEVVEKMSSRVTGEVTAVSKCQFSQEYPELVAKSFNPQFASFNESQNKEPDPVRALRFILTDNNFNVKVIHEIMRGGNVLSREMFLPELTNVSLDEMDMKTFELELLVTSILLGGVR
jgi:hypothetical protein